MSWTKRELLEEAARYRRELEAQIGGHYAALAGVEVNRFIEWLDRGRGPAGDFVPPVDPPGAGGGSAGRVPPRLAAVVEDWVSRGRPAQHASTWKLEAWLAKLPEHAAILSSLPREIDRPTVRAISAHAAEDPGHALRAFLATMVWGFGTRPLGPFRTARILEQADDAPQRLLGAARAVSLSAEAGYDHLAKAGRMRYLGPAFGTKFLLFTQPPNASPTALILDSFVAEGLEALADSKLDPVPWKWPTYERYLGLVHRWAPELGVTAEELEYVVFQWVADRRGGQWADPG